MKDLLVVAIVVAIVVAVVVAVVIGETMQFGHEQLDIYRLAIDYVERAYRLT